MIFKTVFTIFIERQKCNKGKNKWKTPGEHSGEKRKLLSHNPSSFETHNLHEWRWTACRRFMHGVQTRPKTFKIICSFLSSKADRRGCVCVGGWLCKHASAQRNTRVKKKQRTRRGRGGAYSSYLTGGKWCIMGTRTYWCLKHEVRVWGVFDLGLAEMGGLKHICCFR